MIEAPAPAAPAAPAVHRAHSELGASVFKRNAACPGSRAMGRGMPNQTSKYAAEGTVAHGLGEEALELFINCRERNTPRATSLQVATDWLKNQVGTERSADGFTFTVDADMVKHVIGYVRRCVDAAAEDGLMWVEERVDLSELHPGMYGTCDFAAYRAKLLTLYSRDFKYGAGVAVEDPDQMLYYALGVMLKRKLPVREVVVDIDQPRAWHPDGPVRRFHFTATDMVDFAARLVAVAQATEDPNAPLHVGEHCQFCPGSPICPALAAFVDETITEIDALMSAITAAQVAGKPLKYDPARLDKLLRRAPIIQSALRRLEEFARFEAQEGRGSPGHKLVAGKGERYFSDAAKVRNALQLDFGLAEDDILTPAKPRELRSPAQIEELLTAEQKRQLEPLVTKIPGGLVLAPLEDRRKPVAPLTAAQAFSQPIPVAATSVVSLFT